jgi:tetratricopeptide (TPR) repeat protein
MPISSTVRSGSGTMTPAISGDEQADSDALLRHFTEGVARSLRGDGHGSHCDLGVVRKGMGLLDDAIEEFRKALGSRSHRLPASEALGQGFVEQGRYQEAATVLSRALREPGGGRTNGRCALSSRIFMRRPAALGRGS